MCGCVIADSDTCVLKITVRRRSTTSLSRCSPSSGRTQPCALKLLGSPHFPIITKNGIQRHLAGHTTTEGEQRLVCGCNTVSGISVKPSKTEDFRFQHSRWRYMLFKKRWYQSTRPRSTTMQNKAACYFKSVTHITNLFISNFSRIFSVKFCMKISRYRSPSLATSLS